MRSGELQIQDNTLYQTERAIKDRAFMMKKLDLFNCLVFYTVFLFSCLFVQNGMSQNDKSVIIKED